MHLRTVVGYRTHRLQGVERLHRGRERVGRGRPLALWCAVLLVAASAAGAARGEAEEGEPPPEAEVAETFLDTITVTASRGPRPLREASGSVTIIDAQQIEAQLASDGRDLVRYVPGVYVESSGSGFGQGSFNIRGIGGNRVLTRVDGVAIAEQFEFGPFEQPRFVPDVDAIKSLEILRNPASALYGSDALGGVVSVLTKDPADYLDGGSPFVGAKVGWDSRAGEWSGGATVATGGARWQSSLVATGRRGRETGNQGEDHGRDFRRTAPNPRQWWSTSLLAKSSRRLAESGTLRLSAELLGRRAETAVYSAQGTTDLGLIFGFPPSVTYLVDKSESVGSDQQRRIRLGLEHELVSAGWPGQLRWRVYLQESDSEQRTGELRVTTRGGGFLGPLVSAAIRRDGVLTFSQSTVGGELQLAGELTAGGVRHYLTGGVQAVRNSFDQLRDRRDVVVATGALDTSDSLVFPTRYFPPSAVTELGVYLQDEIELGSRFEVVAGLRYDGYELAVDKQDEVYLSGNLGTEPPVDLESSSLSPKLAVVAGLHRRLALYAQYAGGFRAPPYGAVNSGFTHLAGGVTRLPNPDLGPERSDTWELGLRGSLTRGAFSVVAFDSRYDDFIELVALGFNPATGLVEFQQRNVNQARIRGVEVAGDWRVGAWTVRGSFARIHGENEVREVPLNSIAPPQLVVGLRWAPAGRRWGGELTATLVAAKDAGRVDDSELEQFRPPAHALLDLTTFRELGDRVSLRFALLNILDEKRWRWADVRGKEQGSSVIDRHTGPGFGAAAALRMRW